MKKRPFSLLVALILVGCMGTAPAPRLHSLAAGAAPEPLREASSARGYQVVIAQVGVPESVDRPQLLVQHERAVDLVEGERWAEPLRRAIPRLLAADLMQQLDGVTVWSIAGAGPTKPDARLSIEISRFESQLGRESVIEALWLVRAGGTERSGRTVARTPVRSGGYDALVEAHRIGLRELSRDIGAALAPLVASAR
jgi:uncharacterized lipoprotein YmbA